MYYYHHQYFKSTLYSHKILSNQEKLFYLKKTVLTENWSISLVYQYSGKSIWTYLCECFKPQ